MRVASKRPMPALCAVAAAMAVLAVPAASSAVAAERVIDFEGLPPNTELTNQYGRSGVIFRRGPVQDEQGNEMLIRSTPGLAHSGVQVAARNPCPSEFCFDEPIFAAFTSGRSLVRLYVGGFPGSDPNPFPVTLHALDENGDEITGSPHSVPVVAGGKVDVPLEVAAPSRTIYFLQVDGVGKFDDLTFDVPDPGEPPPPPTFGLAYTGAGQGFDAPGHVGLNWGMSRTLTFRVNRFDGSTGPLKLAVKSLPAGVTHKFTFDDPSDPREVRLKLTAGKGAEPVRDRLIRVDAEAAAPGKGGAGVHSADVRLDVLADFDVQVKGIEVTQGIQSEVEPCGFNNCGRNVSLPPRNAANPKAAVPYQGVLLVRGKKTIVRVFADVKTPATAGSKVEDVDAVLQVFRNGDLLGGLMPERGPRTLRPSRFPDRVTFRERADALGAYTYTLPLAWSEGKITLKAKLLPPTAWMGVSEAECELPGCGANNSFKLKGIEFVPTGFVDVATARLYINGEDLSEVYPENPNFPKSKHCDPVPVVPLGFAEAVLPLPEGGLRYDHFNHYACVNVTQAVVDNPGSDKDYGEDRRDDALKLLEEQIDRAPGCEARDWCADLIIGVYGDQVATAATSWGVLPPLDDAFESDEPVAVANYSQPDSVAHELSHGLGRVHASKACEGHDEILGQTGEDWPPDERGFMQGVGIDPRAGSGGSKTPYRILAPRVGMEGSLIDPPVLNRSGAPGGSMPAKFPANLKVPGVSNKGPSPWLMYDYMSYCRKATNNGGTAMGVWTSVIGWTRNVLNLRAITHELGHAAAHPARVAAAASPRLVVRARAFPARGTGEISSIATVRGARRTHASVESRYRLVARDGSGTVLSESPMEVGPASEGRVLLAGEAPATGAETIEVRHDGVAIASRRRSATAPVVRVVAPRRGTKVGRGRATVVAWRASDADGDALSVSVDYSVDGGHGWRAIYAGPNGGHVALPSTLFAGSRRARVRVSVSDGFNEAGAVSSLFSAAGRPPRPQITSPIVGQRVAADARVFLSGTAFDDRLRPLGGRRLRWYDGRRLIGSGPRLSARLRSGRRRLRLVATDRAGRRGQATVRMRVLTVAPQIVRLTGPRALRPGTRRATIRIATSIPGVLGLQGRRHRVGPHARKVRIRVRRGHKPVTVRLTLRAHGKVSIRRLTIPRASATGSKGGTG